MSTGFAQASDERLLAASHDSQEAFAVFYRRHERLVAAWLMRRCGRADLVADLLGEVFAAAYFAAPRFRTGPEPAQAWLLGIARNKLLRTMRSERVRESARRRLAIERFELCEQSAAALHALEALDPEELLAGLPSEQRDAVRARVLEDLDYREVAARMAVSEQVARKRVSRGLARLRRRMQQEGVEL